MSGKEPAIKSYFFGKGYRDLRDTIVESWALNLTSAKDAFNKVNSKGNLFDLVLSGIWGATGVSVVIFGTIFFFIVSLLHILLLVIFFTLIYIGFTVVWGIEKLYLTIHEFFVACPYCHKKYALAEYQCEECGAIHEKLVPNSYGILYHKCICGEKLPATFFLNRGALQTRCPNPDCNQPLHREHIESKRIFIPILGGPSAGKSAFMLSAVRGLIDYKASEIGLETGFLKSSDQAEFERIVQQMKKGNVPAKTMQHLPKAFNLALKKGGLTKTLLYLYDPAGEAYQDADQLSIHYYHHYISGMILLIDPFSIPFVRRKYEKELSKTWSTVNPSELPAEDALSRMLISMEEAFDLSKTGKVKKHLAVVISKLDAFGLDKEIGDFAVRKALATSHKNVRKDIIKSKLIRDKLIEWDETALIHQLDTRFKHVQYFSCSALGRIPDTTNSDFVAHNVLEPLLWIFQATRKELMEPEIGK